MSFNFEWPVFSESFYSDARDILAQALNKGDKPPIIADDIQVKELHMGTVPPELEILEIGDLSTDRFRGIFRLTYAGDAYIVLQTKVQANPLNVPRPSVDILGTPRILFAAAPLIVPMTLRLSSLSLRSIVVLVVSRQKGITLVFKNDPLESVHVSSSFDGVESVEGYIQREIEGALREAFRADLPGVVHRLSRKWLSGQQVGKKGRDDEDAKGADGEGVDRSQRKPKKKSKPKKPHGREPAGGFDEDAKIETRLAYVDAFGRQHTHRGLRTRLSDLSAAPESISLDSDYRFDDAATTTTANAFRSNDAPPSGSSSTLFPPPSSTIHQNPRKKHKYAASSAAASSTSRTIAEEASFSVSESIEAYDPTYGLRPTSSSTTPHISHPIIFSRESSSSAAAMARNASDGGFEEYERLVRLGSTGRGLGELLAARSRLHSDGMMNTKNGRLGRLDDGLGGRRSSGSSTPQLPLPFPFSPSYLTLPPLLSRHSSLPMYHSALLPQMETDSLHPSTSSRFRSTLPSSSSHYSSPPSPLTSPDVSSASSSSSQDEDDEDDAQTVSDSGIALPPRKKRPDAIDLLSCSPSSIFNTSFDSDLPITLDPSINDACAQLSTLTFSNQTLSPFTTSHDFFTARSSPFVNGISRVDGTQGRGITMARGGGGGGFAVVGGGEGDGREEAKGGRRKRVHRIGAAKVAATAATAASAAAETAALTRRDREELRNGNRTPMRSKSTSTSYAFDDRFDRRTMTTNTEAGMRSYAPSELSEYFPHDR